MRVNEGLLWPNRWNRQKENLMALSELASRLEGRIKWESLGTDARGCYYSQEEEAFKTNNQSFNEIKRINIAVKH